MEQMKAIRMKGSHYKREQLFIHPLSASLFTLNEIYPTLCSTGQSEQLDQSWVSAPAEKPRGVQDWKETSSQVNCT